MTSTRTSSSIRPPRGRHRARPARTARLSRAARGGAVALVAGAGLALTPAAASANAGSVASVAAPAAAPAPAPTGAARVAVDTALAQVGKAYSYGATGPSAYDCSGLTRFAYAAAGIGLPHSSRAQSTIGTPVGVWDLQPGDLLFFYTPVSHVAMYIGNGQIVHASTSSSPVSVTYAADMPGYAGARRLA